MKTQTSITLSTDFEVLMNKIQKINELQNFTLSETVQKSFENLNGELFNLNSTVNSLTEDLSKTLKVSITLDYIKNESKLIITVKNFNDKYMKIMIEKLPKAERKENKFICCCESFNDLMLLIAKFETTFLGTDVLVNTYDSKEEIDENLFNID